MLLETMMFMASIVLTIILVAKVWNLFQESRTDWTVAIIGFTIALIFYGFASFSFLGSIGEGTNSTIIDGASTITVTQTENTYLYILPFMDALNALIIIIGLLTTAELVLFWRTSIVGRKEGRER